MYTGFLSRSADRSSARPAQRAFSPATAFDSYRHSRSVPGPKESQFSRSRGLHHPLNRWSTEREKTPGGPQTLAAGPLSRTSGQFFACRSRRLARKIESSVREKCIGTGSSGYPRGAQSKKALVWLKGLQRWNMLRRSPEPVVIVGRAQTHVIWFT